MMRPMGGAGNTPRIPRTPRSTHAGLRKRHGGDRFYPSQTRNLPLASLAPSMRGMRGVAKTGKPLSLAPRTDLPAQLTTTSARDARDARGYLAKILRETAQTRDAPARSAGPDLRKSLPRRASNRHKQVRRAGHLIAPRSPPAIPKWTPRWAIRRGTVSPAVERALRTAGTAPRFADEPREYPAPRQVVAYLCTRGHRLEVVLSAAAIVPASWECRCGALAAPPGTAAARRPVSAEHQRRMRLLLLRRSRAELEQLLAGRLAELRTARQAVLLGRDGREARS